ARTESRARPGLDVEEWRSGASWDGLLAATAVGSTKSFVESTKIFVLKPAGEFRTSARVEHETKAGDGSSPAFSFRTYLSTLFAFIASSGSGADMCWCTISHLPSFFSQMR